MKEYKKVPVKQLTNPRNPNGIDIEKLNKLGVDGWEMIMMTNWEGKPAFIYFMRESL